MKNNADENRHRSDSGRRFKLIWKMLKKMQEVFLKYSKEKSDKEVHEGVLCPHYNGN